MSPGAYRLNAKKIRGSIVAQIAYAGGFRLRDDRTLKLHNYAARSVDREEVLDSIQFSPSVMNETLESFWNRVTRQNTHHSAVYGRRLVTSLPKELSRKGMWWAGRAFARYLSRKYRVAVFTAFHGPRRKGAKKQRLEHEDEINVSNGNWHLHTYLSYCVVNRDGRHGLKQVRLDPRSCKKLGLPNFCDVERAVWAECLNRQLAREGISERIDHRSNEARGIADKPTEHLGPHLAALERQGIRTEVGDRNRATLINNARRRRAMPHLENLKAFADVLTSVPTNLDTIRPKRLKQWLDKAFHQGRRDDVRAFSRRQKIILMDDGGAVTVNDDAVVVLHWGSHRQARTLLDEIQAEIAREESNAYIQRRRVSRYPRAGKADRLRAGQVDVDATPVEQHPHQTKRPLPHVERLIPRVDVAPNITSDGADDEGMRERLSDDDDDAPDGL